MILFIQHIYIETNWVDEHNHSTNVVLHLAIFILISSMMSLIKRFASKDEKLSKSYVICQCNKRTNNQHYHMINAGNAIFFRTLVYNVNTLLARHLENHSIPHKWKRKRETTVSMFEYFVRACTIIAQNSRICLHRKIKLSESYVISHKICKRMHVVSRWSGSGSTSLDQLLPGMALILLSIVLWIHS